MKFLPVLAMLLISVSANARSIIVQQNEVLTNVEINGERTQYVGVLNMNFIENTIKVEIYDDICRQFTAAPGEVTCMAMARIVKTLNVPMQKRENSCGSSIYSGVADHRPVDGFRTEISVADHKHRMCRDLPAGMIEVRASSTNPRFGVATEYYLYK